MIYFIGEMQGDRAPCRRPSGWLQTARGTRDVAKDYVECLRKGNEELSKKLAEYRQDVLECKALANNTTAALEQAELRLQN